MSDQIVQAINSGLLTRSNISFDRLRRLAGRDCGVWDELGRGRSILSSTEQLDQYLHSYGPMTRSQWHEVLEPLAFNPEPTHLIDYGCGQGLATALVLDRFGEDLIASIKKVTLIEPSQVALDRAMAIVNCYADHAELVGLSKKLEHLEPADLGRCEGTLLVHIFSNVLDIDGFDHFDLLTKIFCLKGRHSIMAVSHDRNFCGGTTRFKDLEKELSDPRHSEWFSVQHSSIRQFVCNGGQPAIAWLLEVEVHGGSF